MEDVFEQKIDGNFPPEYISPSRKEQDWYGLQYAKAMYGNANRMGARFYYDESDYQPLIEVAQGRQSVDNIARLYGFFRDPMEADTSEQLAYLDIQVLNLAPKYINRAVAKMQKYSYDINVNAVDEVSVKHKEAYANSLMAYYQVNNWLMEMGINAQEMFPDLDVSALPKFLDEMMYDATVNPKIKREIWAEMALELLHYVNNFRQKMREVDWDIVVVGKGHMEFYNDENGIPRCRRINPKYFIGSYVDNENFDDQEYAGYYDWITANQLRKEMLADGKSEEFIRQIIDKWTNTIPQPTDYSGNYERYYDGLTYIPVLRFYFKSEDNRTFTKKKNDKYGFDMLFENSYNYKPEENVQQYFESGERKLIRNSYTSIYGGTWLIDTDIVYNYGRKKLPRTNLVEATLPIKTFAPNMKEGRVVSFCAQMIEPLFMINVAHNKVKEILANGWMGFREIDFGQLEKVALGKGGHEWTPRQVYEFFVQTNTLPKRTQINQYDQSVGAAIEHVDGGVDLADYFTTITTYIQILEQMTSTSVTDSISIPNRLSATVAKQSAQTSDVDMEWLYNAHENIYLQGSEYTLLLAQEAKRTKTRIASFMPAFGTVSSQYFEVPDEIANCEYGMMLQRRPTEEQWAMFYQDVQIALQNQEISIADSVYLRSINNLKQAQWMMAIRAQQYKRDKQAEAQFNNDLAMQANQAAAESKMMGDIEKERERGRIQMEVLALDGRIKQFLQQGENQMQAAIKYQDNRSKERIAQEDRMSEIIKESMRSMTGRYQSDAKIQETVISSIQKAQSDKSKEKIASKKPKTSAK